MPLARYSACDIAWHKCIQQTVLEVSGVVPVDGLKQELVKGRSCSRMVLLVLKVGFCVLVLRQKFKFRKNQIYSLLACIRGHH